MLALVAGRGHLPELVAAAVPDALICALADQPPDRLEPHITFRLETLGSFLLALGNAGVSEVCFCGAITRPQLNPAALDAETLPLVPLFQEALSKGDDGALRVVIEIFEQTGFTVRGAHDLTPELLLDAGVPTQRGVRDVHRDDARAALPVLASMASVDQGQACIIRKGKVLAREDASGTDAMLTRLAQNHPEAPMLWQSDTADLTEDGRAYITTIANDAHDAPGAGAVLFKAPKPGQEMRADVPTIGPNTALCALKAGLDGIVIEARAVNVLEAARVITLLDTARMFLWARQP